ncbi:TM1812 family CRISPR-associated protein [Veillonella sp. VA139]|uniref:TM1812 family CRISPR-associated protein n=1 Tax=Veillonella sp. VA139 TaxID=741830 RepID=UPI0013DF1C7D|nr:TM1812 family CRISPR-associated protein [Veillonella sp. VA139]
MNFWKVLMESITAKQKQQNVHTGTHWFDVSQDTSKVVVPMAHPSQLGTKVNVHGQPTVSTITEVVKSQVVPCTSVQTEIDIIEGLVKEPTVSMPVELAQDDVMAQMQVSVESQEVVQAQVDSAENAQLSAQTKDLVESESDQSNTISVLSGAVHCAVEAFARFGRADMLAQLVKEHPVHKEIEYLVGSLGDFSEAAHLCKGDDMDFAVHAIRQGIKDCESITANSEVDTAFLQYLPTLKESLGDLLDATVHSQELQLAMIQWCLQCGLYQQSVTLSTEWVPTILFNKGVYYTDRTDMEVLFKKEIDSMQRTWKECFVITYRDYAGNKAVSVAGGDTVGAELSVIRDELRGAINKNQVTKAFEKFSYNKEKIVKFIHDLYPAYLHVQQNIRSVVDVMYFQAQYPEIEGYLREYYEIQCTSISYHKQYYQFLQQSASDYGAFIRQFLQAPTAELVERFDLYKGVCFDEEDEESLESVAEETFQKQRIKLIRDCQAMLAYGSAKTDLPQLEVLQFLVEFHYIRHLRNNINHAADKTLVITSDMVKEAVATLVSSLQAGQWLGNVTVEEELEKNRNII